MRKICKKCQNMIVLRAFSEGKCEICKIDILTSHIPCDKLCIKCAEKRGLCVSCGEPINK